MDRQTKTNFLVSRMVESFNKNENAKLFNQVIGSKFKSIRLAEQKKVDEVVGDNKKYFRSNDDLYKFEKGIRTDIAKVFALSNYYGYDIHLLWQLFSWKGKKCGKNTH